MLLDVSLNGDEVAILTLGDGHRYTSQTHGIACNHPEATGTILVVKVNEPVPHVGCWGGFQPEDVIAITRWLDRNLLGYRLDLDRLQDDEYGEAWIPIRTPAREPGVLITYNCD